MIWILAISVFLQTNVLCASIKQSLVSFDNNLRSLNNKIVVDEKQQKIEQLLEMAGSIATVFPEINSSNKIDKKRFFKALLAYEASLIKADDPTLRKQTFSFLQRLYTDHYLKEITHILSAAWAGLMSQEIILYHRLTFLITMAINLYALEDIYNNINESNDNFLLDLSAYIFETKEKSARDPETNQLIELMKSSGNKKLQKVAAACEYLWAKSNAAP